MASATKCPICEFDNDPGQAKCRRCGTPMPKNSDLQPHMVSGGTPTRLRQGQLLANRYYIVAEIGRGGMGSIYRARDNTLKEEVALKTLLPQFLQDKHVVERFFNEARIARTLSHPNIVRVHDIGASQGTVYISMELLSGKSLRQLLEDLMPGDRLPIRTVLDIFDQLCAALEYAHRYTVHRDLKPENVMVMDDGSVKLMDFGISKLMGDQSLTSASMVMGTPHYMSPEQVKHSAGVDRRADIYSMGVMLYETLTGNLPTAIHKPVSKIVRGVPPALDPIIETCLQDDPARRYESAGELRAALGNVREQLGFTDGAASFRSRSRQTGRAGNPRRIAGFVLLALIAAGTALGLVRAEDMRKGILAEGPAPTAALEPSGPDDREPSAGPAPLTLESALALMPSARTRADSAVRRLPAGDMKSHREQLLKQAATWEAAAKEYVDTGPELAFPPARRALHMYLALIRWPEDSVFIPPTETEGGFFIQSRPVTVSDFARFTEQGDGWRMPVRARRLDERDPMVYVTWYDAEAYVSAQDDFDSLPTTDQWSRAIQFAKSSGVLHWIGTADADGEDQADGDSKTTVEEEDAPEPDPGAPLLWVDAGVLEWAQSSSKSDPEVAPEFGDRLPVCGATDDDGDVEVLRDSQSFEAATEAVGFRGVLTLPTTLDGVQALL